MGARRGSEAGITFTSQAQRLYVSDDKKEATGVSTGVGGVENDVPD
jgi:hypothetical protein